MHQEEIRTYIARYLDGSATPDEREKVEAWLAAGEDTTVLLTPEEIAAAGEEMLEQIRAKAGYTPPALETPGPVHRIRQVFIRIAAAVVLLLGVYGLLRYLHPAPTAPPVAVLKKAPQPAERYRYLVTTGKQQRFLLPDSSVVTLNQHSGLRYGSAYGTHKREVLLEKGEAFFEVKAASIPFAVIAANTSTMVLGTAFNIRITDEVTILVKTGKVRVSREQQPDSGKVLTPGKGLRINTLTGNTELLRMPATLAGAWCAATLVFDQHTLADVAATLESRYGVEIRLARGLEEYRISGTFTARDSLQELLEAVCLVNRLHYKKEGPSIFIFNHQPSS